MKVWRIRHPDGRYYGSRGRFSELGHFFTRRSDMTQVFNRIKNRERQSKEFTFEEYTITPVAAK